MRSGIGSALLVIATMLTTAGAALAQSDGAVQFEETFDELSPVWGEATESVYVQDGNLVAKLGPNLWVNLQNQAMVFKDADITMRVRQTEGDNPWGAQGLIFWAEGYGKYYRFAITSGGSYSVMQWLADKNRWLSPVPWRASDAIKKGNGEWNDLRVVTKGNQATIYINDAEVISIKGQVPMEGGCIGLQLSSPTDAAATYEVDELRVQ